VKPESLAVEFDDERLLAGAGVVLTSALVERLGVERLVDETVELGERPGAARPGRKVLSLAHAIALGADSIDDCDLLRAGGAEALLGHRAMAPSTLGTFLRSFSFGHVRQLDRVLGETLRRAWSAGAGPGEARLVIEIDSFVGEVPGYDKRGAGFGYSGERGYHPLLATRSGSGEVVHARLRKGQAGSGRGCAAVRARADRSRAARRRLRRDPRPCRLRLLEQAGVGLPGRARVLLLDRRQHAQGRCRAGRADPRRGVAIGA
jgi:hypothetical protein